MADEQNLSGKNSYIKNTGPTEPDDSPSKEGISEPPSILKTESQTPENTEVHLPHSSHSGKKKPKEYFLEFLMIFLAVSLGFFAENLREHYAEHKHAHQYAILLIQDIKKNIIQARDEIERRKTMQASFDTLNALLKNNRLDSNAQIVKHAVLVSEILPLATTTATFVQMQNSGSLRYIQNIQLISLLTDYFNTLIPLTQTDIQQEFQLVKDNNQKFLQEHFNLMQVDSDDNLLTDHPDLYDWNERSAIRLYNIILNTNTWNQWIIGKDLIPIQKQGDTLIALLQKEYDL